MYHLVGSEQENPKRSVVGSKVDSEQENEEVDISSMMCVSLVKKSPRSGVVSIANEEKTWENQQ